MRKKNNQLIKVGIRSLIALIAVTSNLRGTDFIKNGSFEKCSSDGLSKDWLPVYGAYKAAENEAKEGNRSIKISGGPKNGQAGTLQIVKGFKPGTELKITSHIYIEKFLSGIIKPIHVGFKSKGKNHYKHINLLYTDNPSEYMLKKWLKFEMKLDLSQYPDVKEIKLYSLTWPLGKKTFQGIVYFDKISVSNMETENKMEKQLKQLGNNPVIYSSYTAKAPLFDGKLDDSCWKGCLKYNDFKLLNGEKPFEQTEFMICHDDEYLYVGVKAFASVLNSTNNLINEFREAAKQHDGPLDSDDCIELFLSHDKQNGYYHIIANLNTTFERYVSGDIKDISWNPKLKFKARKQIMKSDGAYYVVELGIPLESIKYGGSDINKLRFNVGREDKFHRENSCWPRLSSFHTYNKYPYLVLGDKNISGFVEENLKKTSSGAFELNYELESNPRAKMQIFTEIRPSEEKVVLSIDEVSQGRGKLLINTAENNFLYTSGLYDGESVIYRTRLNSFGRGGSSRIIKLHADSKQKIAVSLNGQAIKTVKNEKDYDLKLVDGINQVEITADGPVSLKLPWEKRSGTWKVAAQKGAGKSESESYPVTLSRIILNNHSRFFPYISPEELLQIPLGIPQPFFLIVNGLEGQTIGNYNFYLALPEKLEFVGASGCGERVNKRISCSWKLVEKFVLKGTKYNKYIIKYDGNVKNEPGKLVYVAPKKLNTIKNTITLVIRPRKKFAKAGQIYQCFYYGEAENGTIVEAERSFPVKVLPQLNNQGPRKLISLTWFSYRQLDDKELQKEIYAAHARAGFNVAVSDRGHKSMIEGTGMKYSSRFNFLPQNFNPAVITRHYKEIKFIDEKGKYHSSKVPFSYIANDPEVRKLFQDELEKYLLKYKPDVIDWDFEFDVFKGIYTSYDEYTLENFKKLYSIPEKLNPVIIAKRYRTQWAEYMNRITADTFKAVHQVARRLNVKLSLYSGYPSEYTRVHYGINYRMVLPHIDYAMMGYGRPLDSIKNILELSAANGNKPVIFGVCARPYYLYESRAQKNITPALVLRRVADSGYGVMYWGHYASDGRLLFAFNEVNRMLYRYEDFIVDGKKVEPSTIIEGDLNENDIVIYKLGKRLLLLMINSGNNEIAVGFSLKDKKGGRAVEFYSGKEFNSKEKFQFNIPAGRIIALEID
jgi:hypothetical protein